MIFLSQTTRNTFSNQQISEIKAMFSLVPLVCKTFPDIASGFLRADLQQIF